MLHLITAAVEIGGRLCREAIELVEAAAARRARDELPVLRKQAKRGWRKRWLCLLGASVQRSVAVSLVKEGGLQLQSGHESSEPLSVDIWLDAV